jgi:2-oxoglutarate dehydrogenase complex dehydrogenase (E1) component-like enzyme
VYAAKVATEYRQIFGKDVVIDMFCYRRFGHNEGDDPTMTQPIMYRRVREQPTTLAIYAERLVKEGVVTQAELDEWQNDFNAFLDREFDAGKNYRVNKADWLDGVWSGYKLPQEDDRRGTTDVPASKLRTIGSASPKFPPISTCTRPCSASSKRAARRSRKARASIGRWPSTSRSERCWTKGSTSASLARIPAAAPSASATRTSSTSRPKRATRR